MTKVSAGGVELRNLDVAFGSKTVLADLSYTFPTSVVTAILGPNGAGKTTLLRTIIGVVKPKRGEALVMNHLAGSLEAKGKIGYLAEQPGLYERLSAIDNLVFHAKLRGFKELGIRDEACSLLKKYGLAGYERESVSKFSKGMKQRLALARTAMGNPPVLLLDEPTSGLDPDGSELVIGSIKEAARGGASVLMTTHNAHLARRVADSVLLMKAGGVSSSGTFDDVLRPYARVRVKLLSPLGASKIRAALGKYTIEVAEAGPVGEFLVRVQGKEDVPQVMRALLDGGLKPVSVEPGEITYEGGAR